jgi:hypothetical protein
VERISGDDTHVNLLVDLKEAEQLPLINEPLSDVDQALLRFRKWLLTAGDDGEDLVVKASDASQPDYAVQFVWAGSRGIACSVTLPNKSDGILSLLGDSRDFAFAIKNREAGIYLPLAGLKVDGSIGPPFLTSNLSITANRDPDSKKRCDIKVGANISTNGQLSADSGALQLQRWISPAVMLAEPRAPGYSCQIIGPTLVITYDAATIKIDAASGKLLGVTTAATNGNGGASVMSIKLQRGALDALAKSLHDTHGENLASPDHIVAPAVRFCAQFFCHSNLLAPKATPEQRRKIAQVVGRLLDAKSLDPFDDLLEGIFTFDTGPSDFVLPVDINAAHPEGIYARIAGWGLIANDRMFQRRSWPWTVCRSYCMVMFNRPDVILPELQRMADSPDTGPLACLVNAELSRSGNPHLSQALANKGLAELSPEAFAKDAQVLFNGNAQMQAIALQLAENLRDLSDEDVEAVATQLSPNAAAVFRAALADLRKHQGHLTSEQLAAALAVTWNNGVRTMMEAELNRLAAQ